MTATPIRPKELPLMQFYFETKPEGDVAAYLPVRWCVDPQRLLAKLREYGYTRPHLLICIQNRRVVQTYDDFTSMEFEDTNFYIVPIEAEMEYIAFRKSGANRVLAVIVDMANENIARALWRLRRNGSSSSSSLFDEHGKPNRYAFERNDIYSFIETQASQEVEVDPKMFAPEPAEWRKRVVRTFFKDRANDQCHFRKRFWFVSLPLLALLLIPAKLIQLVIMTVATVFMGLPGVDYACLFKPLKLSPDEPTSNTEVSDSLYLRNPLLWVLNPTVLLVPATAIWFFITDEWGWWNTVLTIDAWILGIALVVGIVTALTLLVTNTIRERKGSVTYQEQQRQRKLDAEYNRKLALESAVAAMSCTFGDKTPSLDALPKEKRTIHLRFSEQKGKVCRPYMG